MVKTTTSRWVLLLLIGLAGVCGHARPGFAQAAGEGGSLGGSIAPPRAAPKARRVRRVRAKSETHARALRATPVPQAPAPALVCSLRMEESRNPDGSSCSLVVGFSAGQRVGLFHTTAGLHIGTCEGAIPVDYVRGNQLGFAGHRRVLSDDCRASSGS